MTQSIFLNQPIYIRASACIGGTKEGEGPLGHFFDKILSDDMAHMENWEAAESALQKDAVLMTLKKAGYPLEKIPILFAGDLLSQSLASNFGTSTFPIPHVGIYGACSTCSLMLAIASICIDSGHMDSALCVTSSHFASAEKEFRFPLSYGNQRPASSTWTVTGSAAFLLHRNQTAESLSKITGITFGKITDYGIKDAMNMGAAMAPAAADTITTHFKEFNSTPDDYDLIVTGDLGSVGQKLLFDLLLKKGIDIRKNHTDCGLLIYQNNEQNTNAGGSGCGCSAVVLSAMLLKKLKKGTCKKILFLPTGALLSKTSFQEGMTIPGIAHAIVLEAL